MEDRNLLCPYDDDLFGYNAYGLASLLEPAGWATVSEMRSPKPTSYPNNAPRTTAIAAALHASVPEARRWGRQTPQGRWTTYTEGEPKGRFAVRLKGRPETPYFVEPLARAMSKADVRKALFGRTLAVGTGERPADAAFERGEAHGPVPCLRIDVDQDDAWLHERAEPILAELRDVRRLAEAMGLPFSAYKTGGRGFQALLSLPCPLEPAVASFLSRAVLLALRGRKSHNGASVDKDGFSGLLRLPGGRHAFGNTGLFVDLDGERLFGIDHQAAMVGGCLRSREGDAPWSLGAEEALSAQRRLLPALRDALGSELCACPERDVARILRAEPGNPLCRMAARAFEATGADIGVALRWRSRPRFAGERPESIYHCDRAWAEEAWRREIVPGGWWEWVHMGGKRGMLAAVVLFGPDRAVAELLEKAERHPAASPTDARERVATTKSLWRSFALKGFRPRRAACATKTSVPPPDARSEALARRVAAQAKEACPGSRWREGLLAAILAVALQALRDSPDAEAALSVREIAWRVERAYPRLVCSESKAQRYLSLVLRDDDSEGRPVVEALVRVQMAGWRGERSLFLPGGAVADEILGESAEVEGTCEEGGT